MSVINGNSLSDIKHPIYMDYWNKQGRVFWIPDSITNINTDATLFQKLPEDIKNLVLNILRMFTQTDEVVAQNYLCNYIPIFKNTEVSFMLTAFVNIETVHAMAYKKLTDALGCTDNFYKEFLNIKEMKDKHDQWLEFKSDKPYEVANVLATS